MTLNDYVPALPTSGAEVVSGLERAAAALRNPDFAEDVMRRLGVPRLIRGIVAPYLRRAFLKAADVIDPNTPDPR